MIINSKTSINKLFILFAIYFFSLNLYAPGMQSGNNSPTTIPLDHWTNSKNSKQDNIQDKKIFNKNYNDWRKEVEKETGKKIKSKNICKDSPLYQDIWRIRSKWNKCIGILFNSEGDVYQGEWQYGYKHGLGTYEFVDENKYIGEWINDKSFGPGTLLYANGQKYKGGLINFEKNGKGIFYFLDGDVWDGFWKNDKWVKGRKKSSEKSASLDDTEEPLDFIVGPDDEKGNNIKTNQLKDGDETSGISIWQIVIIIIVIIVLIRLSRRIKKRKPSLSKSEIYEINGIQEKNLSDSSLHGVNRIKTNNELKEKNLDNILSSVNLLKDKLKSSITKSKNEKNNIKFSTVTFLRINTCKVNKIIYEDKSKLNLNSSQQICWAIGVCDAAAQHLKFNKDESKSFLNACLKEVYGINRAKDFWDTYLKEQKKYLKYTQQGGEAFYEFLDNYDSDNKPMPSAS